LKEVPVLLTTWYLKVLQVITRIDFRKSMGVWKMLSSSFTVFQVKSPPQSLPLGKVLLSRIRTL
jgi:hypothetical protein